MEFKYINDKHKQLPLKKETKVILKNLLNFMDNIYHYPTCYSRTIKCKISLALHLNTSMDEKSIDIDKLNHILQGKCCEFDRFVQKINEKRDQSYKCDACNFETKQYGILNVHMKVLLKKKEKRHMSVRKRCNICQVYCMDTHGMCFVLLYSLCDILYPILYPILYTYNVLITHTDFFSIFYIIMINEYIGYSIWFIIYSNIVIMVFSKKI